MKWLTLLLLITSSILNASPGLIKITAVGDIMMGSTYPSTFLPPDNGKELFQNVSQILKSGEIVFGNLEETLNNRCKCIKQVRHGRAYAFRSPPYFVSALKQAGFNVVSLANNHTMDFGKCGLQQTIETLKKAGIKYADKKGDIAKFFINGLKIALMAVSFGPPPGSIVYPMSIIKRIKKLRNKFDIIIVSVHNGKEGIRALHTTNKTEYFLGENRGNVVKFAHMAIDSGADLIIGHGPHVPRAMEIYKKRLIIYSLGNFCTYGWISLKAEEGFAPLVEIYLNKKGEFVRGKIYSFIQLPPGGPVPDKEERAFKLIKVLSKEDFPSTHPAFGNNGVFFNPALK